MTLIITSNQYIARRMTYSRAEWRDREPLRARPLNEYFKERREQLHLNLRKSNSDVGDLTRYRQKYR